MPSVCFSTLISLHATNKVDFILAINIVSLIFIITSIAKISYHYIPQNLHSFPFPDLSEKHDFLLLWWMCCISSLASTTCYNSLACILLSLGFKKRACFEGLLSNITVSLMNPFVHVLIWFHSLVNNYGSRSLDSSITRII